MKMNVTKEVAAMRRMTVRELKGRYVEVFGEQARTGNKDYLVKRIAWRLQVLAEGDITERALRRAREMANDADLRIRAPAAKADAGAERTQTMQVTIAGIGDPLRFATLTLHVTCVLDRFRRNPAIVRAKVGQDRTERRHDLAGQLRTLQKVGS